MDGRCKQEDDVCLASTQTIENGKVRRRVTWYEDLETAIRELDPFYCIKEVYHGLAKSPTGGKQ